MLDRLGRCLKLIVSSGSTSCHEFASQFGLAFFYTRKTSINYRECRVSRHLTRDKSQDPTSPPPLAPPGSQTMRVFAPVSPVLGDPLLFLPAEPRFRDVWLNVTSSTGCFWYLSIALRVPHHGLSCDVAVWLSRGVAKPPPSSLRNVYLYWSWG